MVFLMKAWIIITSTQMYNFKKDYLKIFLVKIVQFTNIWLYLVPIKKYKRPEYFEIKIFLLLIQFMMNLNAPSKTKCSEIYLLFLANVLQNNYHV